MEKIIASSVAVLDSNVITGGGTNVTAQLQAVLDLAKDGKGVHLIMDGAALVSGLQIYSNTVIECLNSDCGFFMDDNVNRPLLRNARWSFVHRNTRNVSLLGGTYNHNCTKQLHHVFTDEFPYPEGEVEDEFLYYYGSDPVHAIYLLEMYGVENLTLRDITFKNQRTYTVTIGNFHNVRVEGCCIDMAEHVHPSNQDGFHFFGPGRFLTIRDVRGCTGDDFINVAPDEMDGKSSITDVLIDGVVLDNCCQGIRMLSRGTGLLDRVTVRNVSGTYRTFGFSIMPFYREPSFGKYGDFYFENINLRQIPETYHYTPLTFFQLGGDFECVTLKNVRFHSPVRNNVLFDIGNPYFYAPEELTPEEIERFQVPYPPDWFDRDWMPEGYCPRIKTFIVDGLTVTTDEKADGMDMFQLCYQIDNFVLKNAQIFRSENAAAEGYLIRLCKGAKVDNLIMEDIFAQKLDAILYADSSHKVNMLKADNLLLRDGGRLFDTDDAQIPVAVKTDIHAL